mmetsp:Transcript_11031/g.16669  ORF Transcript_11031/g.16669 Transcript_11031/m.16669 type:complete len:216 (-) Transcript_11031:578-1225(-)
MLRRPPPLLKVDLVPTPKAKTKSKSKDNISIPSKVAPFRRVEAKFPSIPTNESLHTCKRSTTSIKPTHKPWVQASMHPQKQTLRAPLPPQVLRSLKKEEQSKQRKKKRFLTLRYKRRMLLKEREQQTPVLLGKEAQVQQEPPMQQLPPREQLTQQPPPSKRETPLLLPLPLPPQPALEMLEQLVLALQQPPRPPANKTKRKIQSLSHKKRVRGEN